MLTYTDEITVEEYNDLRRSVNWITVKDKRAQKALNNSFYKLIARKDGKPVGMARIVSDGGYTYFITDVIVRPECQGEHIGTALIDRLLEYIKRDVMDDETVMVSLMAAYEREAFMSALGFIHVLSAIMVRECLCGFRGLQTEVSLLHKGFMILLFTELAQVNKCPNILN
ncbi:N-acetyltransferase [Clostridium sp. OM07-10AC]|nr:N-acetyltransferase [Clostridium sp. OM07-9AC]RHV07524.1 N-acetyltransferase [Clostridium sp. OM07-10AC]